MGHYEKACRGRSETSTPRDYAHTKRARSVSKDKGSGTWSKSRIGSRGKGKRRRKRERSQTPSASYLARARAVSTTRYSDSDINERRSRTSSRSPDRSSNISRYSAKTKKVNCQQGKGLKEWEGIRQKDVYALVRMKHKMKNTKSQDKQHIKKLHCNIFRGKRPSIPSIMCVAYKNRKSEGGREVVVTPDTSATMTVIPWSLVRKIRLDLNMDDDDNDLVNASGDKMTLLGTVVIYLHPTGSYTAPV